MEITRTASSLDIASARASSSPEPTPPTRWTRWFTSPIAKLDYGTSRVPLWAEARLPAEQGVTGALRPSFSWGGRTLDEAIAAARALAARPTKVDFSWRNGRVGSMEVNPAIAVLRDARAGAYWLAPMQTTVRLHGEWVDAPHAIDGAAFEGAGALLATPKVVTATRELVAVVGRELVLSPGRWHDAPDDSRVAELPQR